MLVRFQVFEAEEGGYTARAIGHSIFTEAETWQELETNIREAAALHFDDEDVQTTLLIAPPGDLDTLDS